MLTRRERFLAVLKFEKADYIPNMEWGSMSGEMILRWRAAGMPRDVKLNEFFGLEGMETIRFGLYDPIPGAPDQGMIEQTEEGTSLRNCWGTGVNHLWPMEVNAGVKVDELRKEYGHAFSMRGGIAKGALVLGKDAIDRELDRVAPVVQDGGYIPMLDHQIEPATEFDNFCYYMEQKRILLGISS